MHEIISVLAVHDACPQGMPICFVQRYHSSHADIVSLLTTLVVDICLPSHNGRFTSACEHSTAQHSTAQHSTAQHCIAYTAAAQVHVTAAAITLQTLCAHTMTELGCISGMG